MLKIIMRCAHSLSPPSPISFLTPSPLPISHLTSFPLPHLTPHPLPISHLTPSPISLLTHLTPHPSPISHHTPLPTPPPPHLPARVGPGEVDTLQREGFSAGHVVGGHDETESLGRGQVEPLVVQVEDQLPPRHVGHLTTHTTTVNNNTQQQ